MYLCFGEPLHGNGTERWCIDGIDQSGRQAGVDVNNRQRYRRQSAGIEEGLAHRVALPVPDAALLQVIQGLNRLLRKEVDKSDFHPANQFITVITITLLDIRHELFANVVDLLDIVKQERQFQDPRR